MCTNNLLEMNLKLMSCTSGLMDGNFFFFFWMVIILKAAELWVTIRNLSIVVFPAKGHFLLRVKLGFADLLLYCT